MPLATSGSPHVLGGLVVASDAPGLHGVEDVLLVEPIANLLAVALEHRRLDERAGVLAVVEERNRLAREIHDTLAQSLAGIIINLESLKPFRGKRSRVEADVLAETEILARGALEEARRSVLGLHPTSLQHHSLRDALAVELSGLAKRSALTTQFYVHGIERQLTPDLATALFRIAQEIFQNIYKHAAARHDVAGRSLVGQGCTQSPPYLLAQQAKLYNNVGRGQALSGTHSSVALCRREDTDVLEWCAGGNPRRRCCIEHTYQCVKQNRYVVCDRLLTAALVKMLCGSRIEPAPHYLISALREDRGDPCEISTPRILFYLPIW